jgi:hypothetical protein
VTVIGEVVRDEGRLAIRATSVMTREMVDLAKPIPPPMTPEESAFDAVMKRIGPAFNAARTAVTAGGGDSLKQDVATLTQGFETTETFWKSRGVADAQKWAVEARAHARALEQAVAASRWDEAKVAVSALQQVCSACHGAYRERQDDGSYRIRAGK